MLATSAKPTAAGKAKASDLGTIKHGKATQVTYGGHPLYTFRADSKRSPTSGEGVNGFYLVSPSGSQDHQTPDDKEEAAVNHPRVLTGRATPERVPRGPWSFERRSRAACEARRIRVVGLPGSGDRRSQ